jgi:hypothetical protein
LLARVVAAGDGVGGSGGSDGKVAAIFTVYRSRGEVREEASGTWRRHGSSGVLVLCCGDFFYRGGCVRHVVRSGR